MKPCCDNPRLQPMGTMPCDVPSIACIEWSVCLTCGAQVSKLVGIGERAKIVHAVNSEPGPHVIPRCCGGEMDWCGIESTSRDNVAVSVTRWRCAECSRVLRLGRG